MREDVRLLLSSHEIEMSASVGVRRQVMNMDKKAKARFGAVEGGFKE